MSKTPRKKRTDLHKDGSLKAKGTTRDGALDGYWEWFRKDGTLLRSGHFEMGRQAHGRPMTPKASRTR